MEKLNELEQKSLVDELTKGRELAKELKTKIGPIASKETCENLVHKILCSYDKALQVLNLASILQEDPSRVVDLLNSPQSFDGIRTPKRECASTHLCSKGVFKKRKTLPKWSEQVSVCSGTGLGLGLGLEGPLDDGFSWRKYGQKDILGATHPRAYYRCTHRNTRGCVATKQVQRSDEDSSIFEVTYRGKHSCLQASTSSLIADSPESEKVKENSNKLQKLEQRQNQEQGILFRFGQGLKVETEEINSKEEVFPPFSFPSTPMESENLEKQVFFEPLEENRFLGDYSPGPITPGTSESNYFSAVSPQTNIYGLGKKWQSSESDLADIISTPSSVTNLHFDLDFPIDQVSFDPDFTLDNLEYFS